MKKKSASIFLLGLLISIIFRAPILRGIGNVLIYENPMEKVPALFVLSGAAWDRGNEAAKLYHQGVADKIFCTGENVPRLFLITKIDYLESELTRLHIVSLGVPESEIELIRKGTSTQEEANHILAYCKKNRLTKVAILSSKFHTRRIQYAFKKFKKEGIEVIVRGAPSSIYQENLWWKSEEGLIFVNNEYIKLLYYWVKH